jgi:hypothetical protein
VSKVWEVNSKDLPSLFREVESKRPAAVVRGIASAILLSAEVVRRAAPKDTKELTKSVRGVLQPGGGYIIVDAPHAGVVEMGARPHWTSVKNLIPWCMRHFPRSEAVRVAYALQAKIAREGQKPTYFMRKTLPIQRRILKAEVERELRAEDTR